MKSQRSRTRICREGIYLSLALLGVLIWATIKDANLLWIVGGMLGGLLWVNWRAPAKILGRLDVQRRVPRCVQAGQWLGVDFDVENGHPRRGSWSVSVHDRIFRQGSSSAEHDLRPTSFVSHVPPGSSIRQHLRFRLPQRGRYRLGPLTLTTRFPCGLFEHKTEIPREDSVIVLPRLGALTTTWRRRRQLALQGVRGAQRPGRAPGDFFAVRHWQSGDSSRWVHWRSSARQGELIVRQFESPRGSNMALIIDLWVSDEPSPSELESVELAVSFAATVIADVCRQPGGTVVVGISGTPPVHVRGFASSVLAKEVCERLAVAEAGSQHVLEELLNDVRPHIRAGEDVIMLSTRPQEEGVLPVAGPLRAATTTGWLAATRVLHINAATPDLATYFRPE